MTYSFTAFADNAIKCSGGGFFRSGPAPPVPPVSYNIADIINTTIFNPPTSTDSYTTLQSSPLSVIQYLDGYIYTWNAYDDYTYKAGSDRRMHINGLSWAQGDSYQFTMTQTGIVQIANFLTGISFMKSTQTAFQTGYGNDAHAYGSMMLNKGSFSISTNKAQISAVTTDAGSSFLPSKVYKFIVKRETNDDITVSFQQDSGTVFSHTKTFATILTPAQTGASWSDINGLFIDRYAAGLSGQSSRRIVCELTKL